MGQLLRENINARQNFISDADNVFYMLGKDEVQRIDPNEHVCVIIWSVGDVIDRARERGVKVSQSEAEDIIEEMEHRHDATIGINWDTIDCYLGDLDDKRKEEAEAKRKEKKAKQKVVFT